MGRADHRRRGSGWQAGVAVTGAARHVAPGLVAALMAVALAVLCMMLPTGASAAASDQPAEGDGTVSLTLFYGEGCPHCAAEKVFLDELVERHPTLRVTEYEVWHDAASRAVLADYEQRLGFTAAGVPVTVVGEQVWIGYSEQIGDQIEAAVTAAEGGGAAPGSDETGSAAAGASADVVNVPLVGEVSLAGAPLLLSTVVIGFVDGVNPCSLWVLSVLLAVVLHSGSRRRVALVGGLFLAVTAAMYGLYIVGFYRALDYLDSLGWIRWAVAGVAGVFGLLQLLDGLAPGRAPSVSIAASRKPGLFRQMRTLATRQRSLPAVLTGTVVLAVGVSLLETPCTAGLPMMWASMLAAQQVSGPVAVALFGVYLALFLVDELVVFAVAVVALRATRVQQRQGRSLKVLSGSLLVTLAVVMAVAPAVMSSLAGTLAVFTVAAALGAAGLWWVARTEASRPAVS